MTEGPQLDERVRMPLLTLITQQSLDEDYLHAAERRRAGAPRPPEGRQVRTAAVVVLVFGVLVVDRLRADQPQRRRRTPPAARR